MAVPGNVAVPPCKATLMMTGDSCESLGYDSAVEDAQCPYPRLKDGSGKPKKTATEDSASPKKSATDEDSQGKAPRSQPPRIAQEKAPRSQPPRIAQEKAPRSQPPRIAEEKAPRSQPLRIAQEKAPRSRALPSHMEAVADPTGPLTSQSQALFPTDPQVA